MDALLRYTPTTTIVFTVTPARKSNTVLSLTNVSDLPVAYKVKTTNVQRYCVCPNAAIIQPGDTLAVDLTQGASGNVPQDLDSCADRFLLQAVKLDDSLSHVFDGKDLSTLFKNASTSLFCKVRFNVKLQLAEAHQQPPLPESRAPLMKSDTPANALPPTEEDTPHSPTKPPLSPALRISPRLSLSTASAAPPPGVSPIAPVLSPPGASQSPVASSPTTATPKTLKSASTEATVAKASEPDYKSVAWARERVLGVRPAPKVSPPPLDRSTRQRVAVERAGELVRVINMRKGDIDTLKSELAEARHKLSDAHMATRPAYDVRYEVNESSRVPFAQICIMAVISGALLQLLV